MVEPAWGPIVAGLSRDRSTRPRSSGVSMVIDTGLGLRALEDLLEMAGSYIDHWKLGFGTSVFLDRSFLQRKLAMLAEHRILTYPGGTLLEVALLEHHCRDYMGQARRLGFSAVEISDGTIPLPGFRRRRIIDCALDAGLVPVTEVGKKNPRKQPSGREIAEQIRADLAGGAEWVIIEGRESGRSVGIYDECGRVIDSTVEEIIANLDKDMERIIWEAPLKEQQAELIALFGCNTGLGNIPPDQILAVEALRCRLRFETLHAYTRDLLHTGRWNPSEIEPVNRSEQETDLNARRN